MFREQLLLLLYELPGETRHVLWQAMEVSGTQTDGAVTPNNGTPWLCSAVTRFMLMPQACSPSHCEQRDQRLFARVPVTLSAWDNYFSNCLEQIWTPLHCRFQNDITIISNYLNCGLWTVQWSN
ncbi:hypothetical protein XENORESO_003399 [Xenotaenia resolanae]|uniref:Uncharacterized protein n=1 Tax=Xenotaenia resolanae TaxID=208358 RepID=A0ABV0WCF3_9TELE